jgi:hypothetical protein
MCIAQDQGRGESGIVLDAVMSEEKRWKALLIGMIFWFSSSIFLMMLGGLCLQNATVLHVGAASFILWTLTMIFFELKVFWDSPGF